MGFKREFNWFLIGTKQGFEGDNLIQAENELHEGVTYTLTKNEIREYPLMFDIPFSLKGIGCLGLVKIVAIHQYAITNKTVIEFILSAQLDVDAKSLFYTMYQAANTSSQDSSEPSRKRR